MISTDPLTDEQRAAAGAVHAWLDNPERKQTFALGGLAGTGKTFLLAQLIRELRDQCVSVQVVAPTGKAAHVLRCKGVENARTIHQWRYDFVGEKRDKDAKKSILIFDAKAVVESADLVIADESSMITAPMLRDMLDPGIPILFVGDHGQLPPVGEDPGIMRNLDVRLETIMRQALDSPITRVAHAVRGGARPSLLHDVIDGDDRVQLVRKPTTDKVAAHCLENKVDRVICGYNRTRHALNDDFRKALGHIGPIVPGDELICLLNNYRYGIWNGSTMTVLSAEIEGALAHCVVKTDDGREKPVIIDVETFTEKLPPVGAGGRESDRMYCDYGWAITCHRAQGSEYGHVLLVWEPFGSDDDRRRWGYTGTSRAKERLVIAA